MSADNVTPIRPGCAPSPDHHVGTMRDIEEVWKLRAQALEHVKAIERLSERMLELPHVWGVCPGGVADHLSYIEAMLTPGDEDEWPKAGDEDYPAWRLWTAFKAAKNIKV